MNSAAKTIVGIFAGLCALWDAYTTYGGMYQVVGTTIIALIFTIFINGAILLAFVKTGNDAMKAILGIIVAAAICCDGYTAYIGNLALTSNGTMEENVKMGIAVGMTILSVGSSLIVSFLIFRGNEK